MTSGVQFYDHSDEWGATRRSDRKNVPQAKILVNEAYCSYAWFSDKDFLSREYVAHQKSAAEIAREVGCAQSTVAKYLLECGIEPRPQRLLTYRKSQLAYGERMLNGKAVPHKGEMQVIEKPKELRAEGLSFSKLAGWLNESEIRPKNGGARWDRRTVWALLQRPTKTIFPS